ncbi:hypothetical protein LMG26411_07914 [Cupriavidus numazuensis]|uniref:Uncharacterized protein n=1 Tax=Cupriavidus numazuensis TaxID=221992 RepID=A0ABM8TW56_9BURK|nr:hypothetical protein LMG26411_07914 [Cupriavidus numazuensis]
MMIRNGAMLIEAEMGAAGDGEGMLTHFPGKCPSYESFGAAGHLCADREMRMLYGLEHMLKDCPDGSDSIDVVKWISKTRPPRVMVRYAFERCGRQRVVPR